ncbi:MAG: Fe-S cluster assembly protein SufD [Beijerinckiaceae bacterium]|nr:Fe-S cluster assembly protein SufD [Beijerinckiaceae bacterium]
MTAHVTQMKTAAETALAAEFVAAKAALPGTAAVGALRESAFAVIAEKGLPHRRVEHWHYTDLRSAMRDAKPLAGLPDAAALAAAKAAIVPHARPGLAKLVLLDGSFVPELSDLADLPQGVQVMPMAKALAEGNSEVIARLGALEVAQGDHALALNASFMSDGVVIVVAADAEVKAPLNLIHLRSNAATASFARSLVLVNAGAKFTLIEAYESTAGRAADVEAQLNDALEIVVGEGAEVEHVLLQQLPRATLALTTMTVDLAAQSAFNSFALVLGAGLSRRQLYVRYSGEHAKAGLRGASLLKDRQHADTTLIMDHAVPNGESRELFKHVLDGASTGVYQGKVIVRPHAQKTDGGMKSNALLLSDDATMNNKPELEIFADDVVCGHGATVGALDEDLLFYLMARGLPKAEAERLLIQAFVGEAIEFVSAEPLRDALNGHVDAWLSER